MTPQTIMDRYRMVQEFHTATDAYNAAGGDGDRLTLRRTLLLEELDELLVALAREDRVGVADAITDTQYIILGTFDMLPLGAPGAMPQPRGGGRGREFEGNITRVGIVRANVITAFESNTLWALGATLHHSYWELTYLAAELSIPLDACWEEVHRSNMAKVGPEGVRFREDGKILKPDGWTPPNIQGVLDDARKPGGWGIYG